MPVIFMLYFQVKVMDISLNVPYFYIKIHDFSLRNLH